MIFGFALLVMITVVILVIALGKVEEKTSFGLQYLVGTLSTLSGGFAQWAFSGTTQVSEKKDIDKTAE